MSFHPATPPVTPEPDPMPLAPEAQAAGVWLAGARYPGGVEIWCARRGGEAALTPDKRLAAVYPSESVAAMAARHLADGNSVPFWIPCDR